MKRIDKEGENTIGIKSIIINSVLILLLATLSIMAYFMPASYLNYTRAEYYARHIFPYISFPLNSLSNFFMQSLTEMFAVLGGLILIVLLIVFIINCIKKTMNYGVRGLLKYALKRIRIVLSLVLIGVIIFQLMIGINYNRIPVAAQLGLDGKDFECEAYLETLNWAYREMIAARKELGVDYNGVAHMSTSYEQTVYDANAIILGVDDYFDMGLTQTYVRAKPVMLSYLWTYTGIVGFYDALLGEANINVDYMDILDFPVTVCHEIIHVKGYSREYDANTLAIISCIESNRADFRYAGFFYIFSNLYSVTLQYAEHEGLEVPRYTEMEDFDMVRADIEASNMYYDALEDNWITDFIETFSNDVNDTYLESNNQQGGVETYHVPTNIYVDFYYTYVLGANNAEG